MNPHVLNQDDEKYDKYAPFKRRDVPTWNTIKLFPLWLMFWPKFLAIGVIVITYTIWIQIIMIGHK